MSWTNENHKGISTVRDLGSVDCGAKVNGVRRTNPFGDGMFIGNQTELWSDLRSSERRRREMFIANHQSELPELLTNIPPLRGGIQCRIDEM